MRSQPELKSSFTQIRGAPVALLQHNERLSIQYRGDTQNDPILNVFVDILGVYTWYTAIAQLCPNGLHPAVLTLQRPRPGKRKLCTVPSYKSLLLRPVLSVVR